MRMKTLLTKGLIDNSVKKLGKGNTATLKWDLPEQADFWLLLLHH